MSAVVDDNMSEHCLPFVLDRIRAHRGNHDDPPPPFFLGVSGVQGAGKTTLVASLGAALRSPPYSLPTAVLSIDDLYLSHAAQAALAAANPSNPLVQHRGEPGTHDLALSRAVFAALRRREHTRIPVYDKSCFAGAGDRGPVSTWAEVNRAGEPPVEVVIFEGWCVGYRALPDDVLAARWTHAKQWHADGQLARHSLANLRFVNDRLHAYNALNDMLDALVHVDAEHTRYVYDWRLQQEASLRAATGSGMTDAQVIDFVHGYYPAYELYTDDLRAGIFQGSGKGTQLRLVVGKDRRVKAVKRL